MELLGRHLQLRSFRILPWVIVFVCLLSPVAHGQIAPPTSSANENFDLRDPELRGKEGAATLAHYRAQALGSSAKNTQFATRSSIPVLTALAEKIPNLQSERNRGGNPPEIVGTLAVGEWLKPASQAPHEQTARIFLAEEPALYGLKAEQVSGLIKIADYTNPAGNLSWVEFRQELNGLPVFQGEIQLAFDTGGALIRTTGNLAAGLDAATLVATNTLTPAEALIFAGKSVGYTLATNQFEMKLAESGGRKQILSRGPFQRDVNTELVYFAIEPGVATLAYSMILWEPESAYYILVDATDGTLLWRKNLTDQQTQTATYGVYTNDSPAPLSPTTILPGSGTQAPGVARTLVTLIGNEPPNTFNNLGWITDGGNLTSGNNVHAGLDLSTPDGIDAGGEATGSPSRVFNFSYNPPPLGTDAPTLAAYQAGVTANLFYWANIQHDALYRVGFTEAARNFQNDNFSRGGLGSDSISAQAQDYSGSNSGNFSTPPDGSPGKLQLFVYTGATPNRDGALDADIFMHELSHGMINRLHGNASGLTTTQAGGMGEGWADFCARCLLSTANENVNGIFAVAPYTTYLLTAAVTNNYYYGLRRFPYAVMTNVGVNGRPHNPLTFADIDIAQINLSDGAYPPGPIGSAIANEKHNIGEVWCLMLLEMRARMINRLGWAVGNQRALQIVTDGMKLDPLNPTLVQARDSIIAADNGGFGGADLMDIRTGFATRGAGINASVTGTSTVVESFFPAEIPGTITFSDSLGNNNGFAEAGEDLVFTVPLTNKLTVTANPVTAMLGTFSASYGSLAANATVSRTFSYRVPAGTDCGTLLNIPFVISSPNGIATVTIPLRVGAPSTAAVFSQSFDAPTVPPALPAGWTTTTTGVANTPWTTTNAPLVDLLNSAFSPDVAAASDASLVSPVISITAANAQLSFKHRYALESGFDGGVLEMKVDAGAFTDIITAGGAFVQGGYNNGIPTGSSSPIADRGAWTGTQAATLTTIINLPVSLNGHDVQFRWRLACDSSIGSTGWNVDSVLIQDTTYACASIDSDGDGIPNGYESAHGLNPGNPADAALDSDGDGQSNLKEYLAGTDPQNSGSSLRITFEKRDNVTGNVTVAFPSVNGHTYVVEWSASLLGAWTPVQGNIAGSDAVLHIVDTTSTSQARRFYRVRTS